MVVERKKRLSRCWISWLDNEGKLRMEIIRRDELQELLEVVRMNPYGKFLITGTAGSGKTFLL